MLLPERTQFERPEDVLATGGQLAQEVLAEARMYQDLLNSVPDPTQKDKEDIIHALDARWPYYNKRLHISGVVVLPQKPEEDPERAVDGILDEATSDFRGLKKAYVEGLAATSEGFMLFDRPVEVSGVVIGSETVVGMYFLVGKEQLPSSNNLFRKSARVYAIGAVDDLIIQYPDIQDDDMTANVEYFFPDVAAEIDMAMLNAKDEVEAVEKLGDVRVPYGPEETPQTIGLLTRYAESLITFDTAVPYEVVFSGLYYQYMSIGNTTMLLPYTRDRPACFWAYPKGIELLNDIIMADDSTPIKRSDERRFGLHLTLLAAEGKAESSTNLVIPLSENFALFSIRKAYYANKG